MVLDWNERAVRFYERLGAQLLSDWRICRLDEDNVKRLAASEGETEPTAG